MIIVEKMPNEMWRAMSVPQQAEDGGRDETEQTDADRGEKRLSQSAAK